MAAGEYTFQLPPGGKTRWNAGAYDPESRTPRYTIEVLVPEHVRYQIETKQFLMGTPGNYLWVWDIQNKSTWPAFVSVLRDGVLVDGRSGG